MTEKKVEQPLQPYLFVRIAQKDYWRVLTVPGVVKFISFSDKPFTIPELSDRCDEKLLADASDIEVSSENFEPRDPVEIVAGNLMGLTGDLIVYEGNKKVIPRIDQLDRSLLMNISSGFLKRKDPWRSIELLMCNLFIHLGVSLGTEMAELYSRLS